MPGACESDASARVFLTRSAHETYLARAISVERKSFIQPRRFEVRKKFASYNKLS